MTLSSLKLWALTAACVVSLGACASHTHEIAPAYVSPTEYEDFSCKKIKAEMARVTRRAQAVAADVNKNADGDSTAMGVGLILFWPALFFIDGDSPQAQEYAQLKGRFAALEDVNVEKDCNIKIEKDPFAEIELQRKVQTQQTRREANK